jgi:uncharacterized protein YjeT (DUF2065 family)
MQQTIYTNAIAAVLLLSGLLHIFRPQQTGRWLSNPKRIRIVGAVLLLAALPCLFWRGWFFWTVFALLIVSGVWRLFFPQHSIRSQQRVYPRWVHGCVMLAGAFAIWTLAP